jgi:hypothetical protein
LEPGSAPHYVWIGYYTTGGHTLPDVAGGNARLRSDRDFNISVDLKALTDAMTEVMWHCDDPVVCLPDADGTP